MADTGQPDAWTPGAILDATELWVFWICVIFLGSHSHELRRVHTHPLRRSSLSRWFSLPSKYGSALHPGLTTVHTHVLNQHQFWRRVQRMQWVYLLLSVIGILVTLTYSPESKTLFLPFLLQAIWLYSASDPSQVSLEIRWYTICTVFSITLVYVLCELLRCTFGYEMSTGHWISVALLAIICMLSGTQPGSPSCEAHGGKVIEVAHRERDPVIDSGRDEEDSPGPMNMAPSETMDNSVLGALFFTHVFSLIRCERRRGMLGSLDVPVLGAHLHAEVLGHQVERAFGNDAHSTQPRAIELEGFDDQDGVEDENAPLLPQREPTSQSSDEPALWSPIALRLLGALVRANSTQFFVICILTMIAVLAYYGPAFFANRIFHVLEADQDLSLSPYDTLQHAMPWVLGLFLTVIASSTLQGALWSRLEGSLAIRLSTQLSMLLFNKTLNRQHVADTSSEGKGQQQVLALQLVDLERIVGMSFHLFAVITTPLELCVGGYFAYRVLGISAIVGLGTSVLLMPVIGLLSRHFRLANEKLMASRDKRMALLNECFLGIRMIKSQAWERVYKTKVEDTRSSELGQQLRTYVYEAMLSTVLEVNPLLVTLVAFTFYTQVLKHTLTPAIAFTSLAIFTELRWTLVLLPRAITSFLQTLVSARRVGEFLVSTEVTPSPYSNFFVRPSDCTLRMEHATVSWPTMPGQSSFRLSDINLVFSPGKTLICGRVGAGKTLLLHALLHEVEVQKGEVICPRSPRQGVPYNAHSRAEALRALGTPDWLRSDLVAYAPQVPFLMHTTIRDNVLFGLPLGDGKLYQAVLEACGLAPDLKYLEQGDLTPVGENGMELSGGQKARVSLARAVYSRAKILLLDDIFSAVDAHTSKHLLERLLNGPLLKGRTVLLVSHNVEQVAKSMDQVVYLDGGRVDFAGSPKEFLSSKQYMGWQESDNQEEPKHEDPAFFAADAPRLSTSAVKRNIERREKGGIASHVWGAYIQASSGWALCMITVLLFALTNLWGLVTNLWLRDWSASDGRGHTSSWWLIRYAGLLLVGIMFGVLRWIGIYTMSLRASRELFEQLIRRTLHAPLRFFDSMSRGRLLNRFGQDLEVLDSKFATAIADVAIRVTQLLATSIALFIVGGIGFVIALFVLLPVYGAVAQMYIAVARDLQRLRSTSRSLVASSFTHAVHGVQVIRAFGAQEHFECEMMGLLDNTNRFVWWAAQGGRWVSQMYNLTSSVLMLVACVIMLLQPHTPAATIDFSLTFLIDLNFVLLILMRMYTQLQVNAVAVERVFEYAASIEQEAARIKEPRPPSEWPSKGDVQVRDLVLRYAPDAPDVVKRISFSVPSGSKLAIVGPTGSGKSSLFNAFLRLLEPQSGSIVIDGWNIGRIGLEDLRSRLYLVPQDPVILSGTLRSVLDVLGEFDDAKLLACLEAVHLVTDDHSAGKSPFSNLDMPIAENGSNLSQGQRQLLCVARALLHKSRIVLFDEASSCIDYTTDMRITETVHQVFDKCTVITIAHRLRTVIGYDKVMYMDHGKIMELDEPAKLLDDKSSHFYRLCKQTGPAEFQFLVEAAKQAASKRQAPPTIAASS